jgi:phosphoglycerate kinase
MVTLKNADVENKKVIVRVDYNVPVKDGEILDTKKIDDSFETLDYLISKNCKIILLSHFGRVKSEEDKKNNSLKVVFDYIKGLNKYNILFCAEPMGNMFDTMARTLMPKQIILVENTRFLDVPEKLESSADVQLSMYYAHLADFYIDDAFGSMHRNHASITGIPKYLPSAIGLLAEKEVTNLDIVVNNPKSPFVVLMGGAKLDDKIELIYALAEKADFILLGGGIANTFLKAAGYKIGSSLVSDESLDIARAILKEFPDKIILPKDVITSPSYSDQIYELKKLEEIDENDVIGDIGSGAIENYKRIIDKANTIFINGTVGMYEQLPFSNGTREILEIIGNAKAKKIVGGGDAAASVKKFNMQDKMDFISTGGGATLYYISNGTLPGLAAIEESNEKNIC